MGPEEAARKAKFDQLMMEKEPEIKALEKRCIVAFKNLSWSCDPTMKFECLFHANKLLFLDFQSYLIKCLTCQILRR